MKMLTTVFLSLIGFLASGQKIQNPTLYLQRDLKQRFSYHSEIEQYCNYIINSQPGRFKKIPYGRTPEGRNLFLVVAASAKNLQNLEQIRNEHINITEKKAQKEDKLIIWLSYNIHGDEASGSEAALELLFHISQNPISDKLVVLIDPNQNPDGRERYVQWFGQTQNPTIQPNEFDAIYKQAWPHGRYNHYLSDLNRDWLWQVQPESKQRMALYQQWMPHIHGDFHEMEPEKTYFFPPSAEPVHKIVNNDQKQVTYQISTFLRSLFEKKKWPFYTEDEFDLLYPSYADSYATFNGSIGLTFEQGGSDEAGIFYVNAKEDTVTLEKRVQKHFEVSKTLIDKLPDIRTSILHSYADYFQAMNVDGTYIIRNADKAKTKPLRDFLDNNEIIYFQHLTSRQKLAYSYQIRDSLNIQIHPGDLVIPADQKRSAMLKVLFEPSTQMADLKTYDITAWAAPYLFSIEAYAVDNISPENYTKYQSQESIIPQEQFGLDYHSSASAAFLMRALQTGSEVYRLDSLNKTQIYFSKGKASDATWKSLWEELQNRELQPKPIERKDWRSIAKPEYEVTLPRVALIYGEDTHANMLGDLLTQFEQEWKIPYTRLSPTRITKEILEEFDVLVFPDGNYRDINFNQDRFKRWLADGGKLVLIQNGMQIARNLDILKLHRKNIDQITYSKNKNAPENLLQGALFHLNLNDNTLLGKGFNAKPAVLLTELPLFETQLNSKLTSITTDYSEYISGYVGSVAAEHLPNSFIAGTYHFGKGGLHLFAINPAFRGILEDGKLLLANAILWPLK
ncbi:M14 family zinc carboxypeptidase [Jiulongibacter sp. NS-SX5]|uniref:M14 family zinc carboxypeptidase n=1 Tax=Jiulongibacter sp. NS-SX5 TaxID=3463854 RepID=UPI004059C1B7